MDLVLGLRLKKITFSFKVDEMKSTSVKVYNDIRCQPVVAASYS